MKFLNCYLFAIVFHVITSGFSQEKPTSKEALEHYEAISKSMDSAFPVDEIRTYTREAFSQLELESYLSQHFQRMDLLQYIKEQHNLKLNAYLHSGNWFKTIGFPMESIKSYQNFFDYFKISEKYLTETERENLHVMRFFSHSMLAENYANLGMLEEANAEHQLNMAYTKTVHDIYHPSSINNYGLFLYLHKRELDSALFFFKRSFHLTETDFLDHTLKGSIRDNIADIYIEQGKYQQARPLYAFNFKFYQEAIYENTLKIDEARLVSAGTQLVMTDIHLNSVENAQKSFNELEAIVLKLQKKNKLGAQSVLEYYRAKEGLLHKLGQNKDAYATAKMIEEYSDSLADITTKSEKNWQDKLNDITLDRVALNYKIDQIEKDNQIKNQRTKLWISGLISSVFIILLMSVILRRRQHLIISQSKRLIVEQDLENSNLKVQQLNSEIKSKERDLSDFAINLIQNQEWASGLATKMEDYKRAEQTDKKDVLFALEQDIQNKITFDHDTKLFFERLDKLSDAFYSQLMTNYPNLSKNEIQLCSLIRLKMDSRSISTLQNITNASLNTSRYRLRKKLELSDDVNLDDFIQLL